MRTWKLKNIFRQNDTNRAPWVCFLHFSCSLFLNFSHGFELGLWRQQHLRREKRTKWSLNGSLDGVISSRAIKTPIYLNYLLVTGGSDRRYRRALCTTTNTGTHFYDLFSVYVQQRNYVRSCLMTIEAGNYYVLWIWCTFGVEIELLNIDIFFLKLA